MFYSCLWSLYKQASQNKAATILFNSRQLQQYITLQLFVYYIVTTISSTMNFLFNKAQCLINDVYGFLSRKIGKNAKVVLSLMVAFLLFVAYHILLVTLEFFAGIFCQFLISFCACLLALVVYNSNRAMLDGIFQQIFA